MLQNTFIHIQSIGAITEQRLWESGLRDWDAFSDDISIPLSDKRKYILKSGIDESRQHSIKTIRFIFQSACLQINPGDFSQNSENSMVYLDIETTGLDRHYQSITTIALYDGQRVKTYVNGQNLDDFIEEIQQIQSDRHIQWQVF